MPPSQLKRLKASLREKGITGQQRSKKAKKRDGRLSAAQRGRREAALAEIRETFNPFEVKAPTRPSKFDVTSNKTLGHKGSNGTVGRPGVTKSYGEETRRKSLLPDLHKRSRVGGIIDRRIGESDPTMTPDERMQARYAREKSRHRDNMFNLEDDDAEDTLTHLGRSLAEDEDDFDEQISQASSDLEDEGLGLKRKRQVDGPEGADDFGQAEPDRKRSRAEIMKEVVAKSKLHKYERQQAKEDDEDLIDELDKGMGDLFAALRGHNLPKPAASSTTVVRSGEIPMDPGRAALMNGIDISKTDKNYDARIRQMTLDKRAQPTERTKTDEEKARDQAERLKTLEEERIRRMNGEDLSDDEEEGLADDASPGPDEEVRDDAAVFGLQEIPEKAAPLDVEDEDDFIIDEDLVADGSDIEAESAMESDDEGDEESISSRPTEISDEVDDDDDLISGLLDEDEKKALLGSEARRQASTTAGSGLAYTYPCPTNHEELLEVMESVPISDLPVVIQRIRALYDPKLSAENKSKLAAFAASLVKHLVHLGDASPDVPLTVLDTVIRHVHSLSRTFVESISQAFREELQALYDDNKITRGRLVLLTALGTIYPTSDHFHQVVNPAMTLVARWLGLTTPKTPQDFANGAFLGALCIKFQRISKRYIPELIRFTAQALRSPNCPTDSLAAHIANLNDAMTLWFGKTAFVEIFSPSVSSALKQCQHSQAAPALKRLKIYLAQARHARRPLALHHHRPLPIKTAIPMFEDNFNPDKHYDPNYQRSEASKLRAEYKRERKGALRELRKDANFIAREQLREKKERDRAHEEKERKLIAEINAEEGRERKEYEREKKKRKMGR